MVVSLHDVAPSTRQIANTIILELANRGVRVCSLLVVPDYHRQGLSTKDQQFVSWLRGLEADGHEIVIHGYFHERPRRAKESLRDKFLTRFYTQNEGEFYDLGYDEALRRIVAARDELRAHGLKPRGFVAPAWLLGEENATLFRFLKGTSLLRISIHPSDYSHGAIWRQITELIEESVDSRTATTYQEWIAEQRLRRGI